MNLNKIIILAILEKNDSTFFGCIRYIKEKIGYEAMTDTVLYAELAELEQDKIIASYNHAVNGENKKFYMITEMGGRQYREQKEKWKKLGRWLEESI